MLLIFIFYLSLSFQLVKPVTSSGLTRAGENIDDLTHRCYLYANVMPPHYTDVMVWLVLAKKHVHNFAIFQVRRVIPPKNEDRLRLKTSSKRFPHLKLNYLQSSFLQPITIFTDKIIREVRKVSASLLHHCVTQHTTEMSS